MNDEASDRERERPSNRYSLFVGIAFIVVVLVATLNTLRTREDGILGTSEADRGERLAEFAVPELLGTLEGDANVYQRDCESTGGPCPPEGGRPACEIEVEQVIRVCDLFARPLVVSFWFTGGAECLPTQDTLDRVASRFENEVNFLSVNVLDERDEAREVVAERNWEIPVGYDADGAVANLYRVGVCPTVVFADRGGVLREVKLGTEELTEPKLLIGIERLVEGSRRGAG